MKRKYLYLAVLLILLSLFTTGCFRVHTNIELNRDGSGTWNYIVAISEDLNNMQEMQNTEDPMTEIQQEAYAAGFSVEDYEQDGYVGVKLSKDFTNVEDIKGQNFLADLNAEEQSIDTDQFDDVFQPEIRIEEGFFYTRYIVETEADLTIPEETMSEGDEFTQEMQQFSQVFLTEMMDIQLSLDLPAAADLHNATTVSNNGKSLSWQLKMNQNNDIIVELQVLNTINVVALAVVIIVVLAIIIILINSKKRGYVEYTKE